MVNKLVLVPSKKLEALENVSKLPRGSTGALQPTLSRPETSAVADYNKTLEDILSSKELSDSRKAALYASFLDKLISFKKSAESAANQPVSVKIAGSDNNDTNHLPSSPQEVQATAETSTENEAIQQLPARVRKKAERILQLVNKQGSNMSFQPSGELVIDGVPVHSSNVVDILSDILSASRRNWTAQGTKQFLRGLARYSKATITLIADY